VFFFPYISFNFPNHKVQHGRWLVNDGQHGRWLVNDGQHG